MQTDASHAATDAPSRRVDRVLLAIYLLGLATGATIHILDLVNRGPMAYTEYPPVWNAFMTSVAVLNPLTMVLLVVRRRAGVALLVAVVATSLVLSIHMTVKWYVEQGWFFYQWLPLNGTFMVFVLATARRMWRNAPAP